MIKTVFITRDKDAAFLVSRKPFKLGTGTTTLEEKGYINFTRQPDTSSIHVLDTSDLPSLKLAPNQGAMFKVTRRKVAGAMKVEQDGDNTPPLCISGWRLVLGDDAPTTIYLRPLKVETSPHPITW